MRNQFEFRDVSVAFQTPTGPLPVLNHISFEIPEGDWVTIVGPNGSGKSTVGRVLAGLCAVSSGSLQCGLAKNDCHVQMVFQNPDAQIVGQTVYEDICFGLENTAVPAADMPNRVNAALALVGLQAYTDASVERLSGGQKQLLCIASALALRPAAIVFDEATAMLDPLSREHVLRVVKDLHTRGMTVIWITHWMEELMYAKRVIALKQGRVCFSGSPRAFFYTSAGASGVNREDSYDGTHTPLTPCEALGFSLPYSVQVVRALAKMGVHMPCEPISAEQLSLAVHAL